MAHWWLLASALDKKLIALNGQQAVPGLVVSYGAKTISGFPFNIDVVFTDFSVHGAGAHGPIAWTSQRFALHGLTYGRTQDIFEAAGTQTLRFTDGGGTEHQLTFVPGSLRASVLADDKGVTRFDLAMVAAAGTSAAGAHFTAGHFEFHLRRDPGADAIDLMTSADSLASSAPIADFLGTSVRKLSLYASLNKAGAWEPLLAGKTSWPVAMAAWHRAGGSVALGPVNIQAEKFQLQGNGFAANPAAGLLDPLY